MFLNVLLYFRLYGSRQHLLGTLLKNLIKGAAANETCLASFCVGLYG